MDWVAGGLLWVGNVILIWKKHWSAFVIFGLANAIWLWHWITREEWAAAAVTASFIAQNLWGIWSWSRKR